MLAVRTKRVGEKLHAVWTKRAGDKLHAVWTKRVGDKLRAVWTKRVGDQLHAVCTKRVGDTLHAVWTKRVRYKLHADVSQGQEFNLGYQHHVLGYQPANVIIHAVAVGRPTTFPSLFLFFTSWDFWYQQTGLA